MREVRQRFLPPYRLTASPHATHHAVSLTMGVSLAVHQAEDSIRMPAVIPEPHGDPVLTRESGRGTAVGVDRDMAVDCSGPLGRAALFDRLEGGDSHRVGILRLEWEYYRHEDGIVPDGAGQACDPLLLRRETGIPQGMKRSSGFRAEAKGCVRPAGIVLCRERRS